MATIDVFDSDAFTLSSLTAAVNKMDALPTRIGDMQLFRSKGVTTTEVWVEEREGELQLVKTSPRGAPPELYRPDKRRARKFKVPHISLETTIYADELQDVRQFGSETQAQTMEYQLQERLSPMRRNVDATLENMRAGAIQGKILDADGSVIYNLFDEFDVTQQAQDFAFTTDTSPVRQNVIDIKRNIETELGAERASGIHVLCGKDWFDNMVEHPAVKGAYERWQDGGFLREDNRDGFLFGGVTFEDYSQRVGNTALIPAAEAYAFPKGTDLFQSNFAPADFADTVNTLGIPIYVRSAPDSDMRRYITLHLQSNPLPLCLRPRACVKLTMS